jgi:predicted small lipoprotein YifL
MTRLAAALVAVAGLALAGCGIKGPLYLPEKSGEVITRPAPASAPPPAEQPATLPSEGKEPPRD